MRPTPLALFLALILTLALLASAQAQNNELTLTGRLQTGIMAIGGETTGITLTVSSQTYELDIPAGDLRKKADTLSGKDVTVKGTLTLKAGVELKQRRIIAVSSLDAAAAATQAK